MDTTYVGAPRATLCVVVASNLQLLSETVAAAIDGPRIGTVRVPWPPPTQDAASPLAGLDADVALVVCDPPTAECVAAVERLLVGFRGRSLVMTGYRSSFWWGAMLAAGADAVIPSTTSLETIVDQLDAFARGDLVMGAVERQILIRQWMLVRADLAALRARLDRLTRRERQVLELLYQGVPAAGIAVRLGVSPTTVRTQIRGILVKLEVGSQLAAVAFLESVRDGPPPGS